MKEAQKKEEGSQEKRKSERGSACKKDGGKQEAEKYWKRLRHEKPKKRFSHRERKRLKDRERMYESFLFVRILASYCVFNLLQWACCAKDCEASLPTTHAGLFG